jgi:hypothetical protein
MDAFKISVIITAIIIFSIIFLMIKLIKFKKSEAASGNGNLGDNIEDRKCLSCGYQGKMKTWLRYYGVAQFIALILLLFFFVPGLIFIAWAWGKYKCPNCGALGKNTPFDPSRVAVNNNPQIKKCPYCAEEIMAAAVKCKHCGSEIP